MLQKYHTVADGHCAIRATATYISRLPVAYTQHLWHMDHRGIGATEV